MKWKQFIENLKTKTSRAFSGFFRKKAQNAMNPESPMAQITRSKKQMDIRMQVGDTDKKDLNIEVQNGYLILSSERSHTDQYAGTHAYSTWREYSSFKRMYLLPDGVDAGDVDARLKNGVLHIKVALKDVSCGTSGRIAVG
jgi:HSP20 family protein